MTFLPSIIEKVGSTSRTFDLPSKLLDERIVYLSGPIDEEVANGIIMQLLWLDSVSDDPINMYINSPGGEVYQGLAIKDVIDRRRSKVNTIGVGMCASMAAYLLFAGTGTRSALPNTRIMMHSVGGSTGFGSYHDVKISFEEIQYLQNLMQEHEIGFSKGKLTPEKHNELTHRDKYMTPKEALDLGLIDMI